MWPNKNYPAMYARGRAQLFSRWPLLAWGYQSGRADFCQRFLTRERAGARPPVPGLPAPGSAAKGHFKDGRPVVRRGVVPEAEAVAAFLARRA